MHALNLPNILQFFSCQTWHLVASITAREQSLLTSIKLLKQKGAN